MKFLPSLALPALLLLLDSPLIIKAQSVVYQTVLAGGVSVGPGNGLTSGKPSDDKAYLTTANGNLYTIQESTGAILSTFTPPTAGTCQTVVEWNDANDMGVYAVGNTVYLIDEDGSSSGIFRIDQGQVTGQPIVSNGVVYVTSNDGNNGFISLYDPVSNRSFARLSFSGSTLGSMSKGADNTLYVGASNGFLLTVDVTDPKNSELNLFGNGRQFGQDMRGRPFATDADDTLLVQAPSGKLFWWVAGGDGTYNVSPDFEYSLASEGSAFDDAMAPLLSSDGKMLYIISGSTTYAYSNGNGFSRGFLRWSKSGETKTKPLLDGGSIVYTVERSSGQIIAQDALDGTVLQELPFTGAFGQASGHALLSGEGHVLTIHDSGILVATCVKDCDGPQPPISPVTPITTPTSAPVVPVTSAPIVAPTEAPVVPETAAPVVPETAAPVVPETAAPVVPKTAAPVVPATPAPVVPATPAPIVPATPAPVIPATPAPVVPATPAPIVPATAAPIVPATAAPIVPATAAPVIPATAAPAVAPTDSPVVAATDSPVTLTDSPVAPTDSPVAPTDSPVAPVAVETSTPIADKITSAPATGETTSSPVANGTTSAPIVDETTAAPMAVEITSAPVVLTSTAPTFPMTTAAPVPPPVPATTSAPITAAPFVPTLTPFNADGVAGFPSGASMVSTIWCATGALAVVYLL